MAPLKCLIADDLEIDRLMVSSYVSKLSDFEIAGCFADAAEALESLRQNPVDVVFLDIDMPGLSGLALREKALQVPVCVFITSHTEYAVNGFELDALDYIVKPLTAQRFQATISRIENYMDMRAKASQFDMHFAGGSIVIREGHAETKVNLSEILYLEALKNYTLIVTSSQKHRVLLNIGNLLKETHFNSFLRVHRGFAVHKQAIVKWFANEVVLFENVRVPVGRSYKMQLKNIE